MVHLPAEEEISVDYRKKTVRPVDTDIAPKGCESNNDGKPEARALQAKYPYRGNLRLNRLPVTEEDARAVSSSPFAFSLSLHTRRHIVTQVALTSRNHRIKESKKAQWSRKRSWSKSTKRLKWTVLGRTMILYVFLRPVTT